MKLNLTYTVEMIFVLVKESAVALASERDIANSPATPVIRRSIPITYLLQLEAEVLYLL